jgi:ferredoxin
MRITLDRTRCTGHGRCYVVAAAVFDADADGYGVVRDGGEVAPGDEQAARRGAANCPEDAITLEE